MSEARPARDWFWLEAGLLVATLVGGAVLRYWLSTAVPFDSGEVAILEDATDPERPMRVPFIMMSGVGLFLFYVIVRRSAGVFAAFAAELSLQGSLWFQLEALRVRWTTPLVLLVLFALAYFRLSRPARRLSQRTDGALLLVAVLFAARELQLLVSLPWRLPEIRRETAADVAALAASVAACGNAEELPVARLASCAVAWPRTRSVVEQEVLWEHQRRLGADARATASAAGLAAAPASAVALLDRRGAGFLLVPEGPLAATARRMLASEAR